MKTKLILIILTLSFNVVMSQTLMKGIKNINIGDSISVFIKYYPEAIDMGAFDTACSKMSEYSNTSKPLVYKKHTISKLTIGDTYIRDIEVCSYKEIIYYISFTPGSGFEELLELKYGKGRLETPSPKGSGCEKLNKIYKTYYNTPSNIIASSYLETGYNSDCKKSSYYFFTISDFSIYAKVSTEDGEKKKAIKDNCRRKSTSDL